MLFEILANWGCMRELGGDCTLEADMSNASSTWIGILIGAVIGLGITYWIYDRQKKTSDKQDTILRSIKDFEESHDKILKSMEELQKHQEEVLNQVLNLDKKIDSVIEKKVND